MPMNQETYQPQEKNSGVAFLLSFLYTGAGQLYAGAPERGIVLIIVSTIFLFLFVVSFWLLWIPLMIIWLPFWIWGMLDALSQANKFNAQLRKSAEDQTAKRTAELEAKQSISSEEFAAQIAKLSKLFGANVLTEEEFAARKRNIILMLIDKKPLGNAEEFLSRLIPLADAKLLNESEMAQIKKLLL